MDNEKTGKLIRSLRIDMGLTQKQLAERISVSDKTVSKWERGMGCPDVSLIGDLSDVFSIDIAGLLNGALDENAADPGNIRRIRFYVCPQCGAIYTATADAGIYCCSRRLEPLAASAPDEYHTPHAELCESDYYITFDHEMTKQHYIKFISYVMSDRFVTVRLYPEQDAAVRIPKIYRGFLYVYCTRDGLTKTIL